MIELDQILEGLILRTTEGQLKWSRTVQSARFVTSIDAISIVIIELEAFHGLEYHLEILDENGQMVEVLGRENTSAEQDKKLERLYVAARRSAHNIDSTLEKLAKALNL